MQHTFQSVLNDNVRSKRVEPKHKQKVFDCLYQEADRPTAQLLDDLQRQSYHVATHATNASIQVLRRSFMQREFWIPSLPTPRAQSSFMVRVMTLHPGTRLWYGEQVNLPSVAALFGFDDLSLVLPSLTQIQIQETDLVDCALVI